MNLAILIGRLTRDVELSYTPNTQQPMAKFTIAVDRPRRNGEDQGADFIRITVWGKQAETCERYLSKGRQVAVQGRIQTGSYTNREGVTVYTTEVNADRVEFLGGGQEGGGPRDGRSSGNASESRNSRRSAGGGNGQANNRRSNNDPDNGFGFDAFEDLPDTFEAAEDDIPF